MLDWAPTASSYCRKWITQDNLSLHLAYLAQEQQEDGGWPIRWQAISPGSEAEWRGSVTVDRLITLQG
ncbi:hypothetical protein D3C76_1328080 [compost metagenome]